jgi:proteic killer suppression protein
VIKTFGSKATKQIFEGLSVRKFRSIEESARRRLMTLHLAKSLWDLASPSNRLEKLYGDRAGQHSIRVNNQYRICFRWNNGNAFEVELVDYH